VACAICEVRKPRRYCPGVRADICAICCGENREETVDCPLDCEYLRDAHAFEKANELSPPPELTDPKFELTEPFLDKHDWVLRVVGSALNDGARESVGVTDWDLREAIDALVQTYKTLRGGIYYESMPRNPLAARIVRAVQDKIRETRQRLGPDRDIPALRDSSLLGVLIFFQRIEYRINNGRKRSKAFLDVLNAWYRTREENQEGLAPPDTPLIIT
jgi:hypothetical protein